MAERIEKKISRIIRWLDRCTLACRGESYGSALMDIECARVDFDSARDEIWNTVNKQYNPKHGKVYFIKCMRTAIASTAILLAIAAPLSFIEEKFSSIATTSSLEWVNSDEKVLLENLRGQLSNANSGWALDLTDSPAAIYSEESDTDIKIAQMTSFTNKPEQKVLSGNNITNEKPVKNDKTSIINETQIFTLLKIGENALMNKPSAVTVER